MSQDWDVYWICKKKLVQITILISFYDYVITQWVSGDSETFLAFEYLKINETSFK